MTDKIDPGVARVHEFHTAFGLQYPDQPKLLDMSLEDISFLGHYVRGLTVYAEGLKTAAALATERGRAALALYLIRLQLSVEEMAETFEGVCDGDPVAVLDGLTDSSYVNDGNWLAFGMGALKTAAYDEVHRSNMSKLDADGRPIISPAGRVVKGPNYSPPDLARVLREAQS